MKHTRERVPLFVWLQQKYLSIVLMVGSVLFMPVALKNTIGIREYLELMGKFHFCFLSPIFFRHVLKQA